MFDSNRISDIVKKLVESVPEGVTNLPRDLEKNFHAVLAATFSKMDLVTREEFDAQTAVLLRTRLKLEQLEEKLKELETK
jgi:BMFP domain-containing protein YqiC